MHQLDTLDRARFVQRMGLQCCMFAQETLADMASSVFCATPPGQTQDSIRVFRAIIKGCIPVTFYRGNDRPFERHLHVRPSALLSLAPHSIAMQPSADL